MASRTAHTLHAQSSLSALAPDGAAQVPSSNATLRHGPFEDAQALFAGSLFVGLAMLMYAQAGLLTGIRGLENFGKDPKDDTNNWQPRISAAWSPRFGPSPMGSTQ